MSRTVRKIVCAFAVAGLLTWWWPHRSAADEHASHHGSGSSGGMGGEMGGMSVEMRGEHGGRTSQFFPSLMNLPELNADQRAQLEQAAQRRMSDGAKLMSRGVDLLSNPEDAASMREGTALIREGLDQFQSGFAASEALQQETPPQAVAFKWFRQQLNLSIPGEEPGPHTLLGLSPFHLFSMVFLIAIATAAIWIYFLRMHRARALMLSLAPGGTPPAGGNAQPPPPSLGGGPGPTSSAPNGLATTASLQSTRADPTPAIEQGIASVQPSRRTAKPAKWSGKLKVLRVFDETPSVRTFRMGDPGGGTLPFDYLPGQFLDLTIPIDGKLVKRSYTIASSPVERDYVEITVKREAQGVVSGYLHDKVKEGDELQISAPSGRFTFTGIEANSIVLIGGGVGITPLMSVIRYLTSRGWPNEIVLLDCFREPRDFIFREELEYLQRRNPNLRVIAAATRRGREPWIGLEGRFTKEIIAYSLPKIASHRIHLCGPPPMMEGIRGILLELGVPKEQIKTEAFGTDQRNPAFAARPATGISAIDAPSTAPQRVNGAVTRAVTGAIKLPAVTFTLSRKSAPLPARKTILKASEEVGVNIDYSCRSGTCGTCKVKLISGNVTMEVDEGLEPEEKQQGYILACQARATADVAVEA
jgi:ferredoxin-NADP reductase